jgi:hypothetical protein
VRGADSTFRKDAFRQGMDDATLPASVKFVPDKVMRYAPLLTMLTSYFFLTVLMNVVFVVYDDRFAMKSMDNFSIAAFPVQTVGYWLLLFLPFLALPPVAILFRRILARPARMLGAWTPEFRMLDYLVITGVCYGIAIHAMYRSDAWGLLWSGSDAISTVLARFELLNRLHFFERAILQSVLVFLTLYSLVRALRSREGRWLSIFSVNLVAMTVLLVCLNMKWPVVVLFGGIVACTALFGRRRGLHTAIAAVTMVCVYLLVATVVLRIPQSSSSATGNSPGLERIVKEPVKETAPASRGGNGPNAAGNRRDCRGLGSLFGDFGARPNGIAIPILLSNLH